MILHGFLEDGALKSCFSRNILQSFVLSSWAEMTILDRASLSPTFIGVQEARLTLSLSVFRTRCITSLTSGDSVTRSLD